jgi:hypothetical protein
MTTTSILVEILIIGIQAAVWLSLVILSILGYEWVPSAISSAKGWETMLSVIGLGVCYTLGIFIDRAADCLVVLYHPGDTLLKFAWIRKNAHLAHSDMRMWVLCAQNKGADFLEHIRSRIRIVRATALNGILASFASILFLAARTSHASPGILSIVIALGLVVSLVSVLCLGVLEVTYITRLKQSKLFLSTKRMGVNK